jgi:putative transposase
MKMRLSRMQIKKTIKCKIHNLTNIKEQILTTEYNDYQIICNQIQQCVNNDIEPKWKWFKTKTRHCSYLSGARKSIKEQHRNLNKQPVYLRNDCFNIIENKNKISKYWFKLPTKRKWGGIYLPIIIPYKYENLLSNKICDSKIIKKKHDWFLLLTIKKNIELKKSYSNILAIDLGDKVIATISGSFDNQKPTFYGRDVREIRRHYAWFRKRLGEKKKLKVIKRIGNTEQRKVNDILHKISRQIIDKAKETNSIIVLGNLKGIRESTKGKGKRFNRIVSHMPHYKLSEYIKYKAGWEGIMTIIIDERGTSHTCSHCGNKGKRPYQGLFICNSCGYQVNADYNGANNIAQRGLEAIPLLDGVRLTEPITLGAWQHGH